MKIEKRGVRLPFSMEAVMGTSLERNSGHYRKLTKEERAQWQEARSALKLIKKSPWTYWDHEDGYVLKEPRKWVADED